MNLSFRFKNVKVGELDLIKRPIIPITINNQGNALDVEALIDSGSDACLLPKDFAEAIEIKPSKTIDEIGIGGERLKAGLGYVTLTITDGKERVVLHSVPIWIPLEGGTDMEEVIIGREPFFRDFNIIFRQNSDRIILERARRA